MLPWSLASLVSALLFTFFLSRLLLRLAPAPITIGKIAAVHIASAALLGLMIGFIKAYSVTFALIPATVVIAPQLLWAVYDFFGDRTR